MNFRYFNPIARKKKIKTWLIWETWSTWKLELLALTWLKQGDHPWLDNTFKIANIQPPAGKFHKQRSVQKTSGLHIPQNITEGSGYSSHAALRLQKHTHTAGMSRVLLQARCAPTDRSSRLKFHTMLRCPTPRKVAFQPKLRGIFRCSVLMWNLTLQQVPQCLNRPICADQGGRNKREAHLNCASMGLIP